jgi:hypothetical protein
MDPIIALPSYEDRREENRPVRITRAMSGLLALGVLAVPALAGGAVIELRPSFAGCDEEFVKVANRLRPGDELVLHGGVYGQSCRRAITVNGTAAAPIVIRAARGERPVLTRPADNIDTQNNIEIVDSSHLVLRGLAFQGGSSGMRIRGGHHITVEGCEIFDTGNNAVAINSNDAQALVFRGNHIHHTGLSVSGPTEGEGFYVGCHDGGCRVTDSVFEDNHIHHTRASSDGGNDGIEIKARSSHNLVRGNVIHDTTIGRRYPCIFVYGGGPGLNIVEDNVMWNCGEAIQVVSDAIVRNNVILSSDVGITAAPHIQVPRARNVTIVNNTLYGHGRCLSIQWEGAANMTLANNAVYCPGAVAVEASGLAGPSITVSANYVEGELVGVGLDHARFLDGGRAAAAFTSPERLDFWPRPASPLIGHADPAYAPVADFNGHPRTLPADVGAYESDGLASNPGWRIAPTFKRTPAGAGG